MPRVHGSYCENSPFNTNNLRETLPPLLTPAELNQNKNNAGAIREMRCEVESREEKPGCVLKLSLCYLLISDLPTDLFKGKDWGGAEGQ